MENDLCCLWGKQSADKAIFIICSVHHGTCQAQQGVMGVKFIDYALVTLGEYSSYTCNCCADLGCELV